MSTAPRSHWPLTVLSVLTSTLGMAMALALARVLAPADLGLFKIFFLYVTLCPSFSFTSGVINGLSYWAGRGSEGKSAIQSSALIVLFEALLVLLIMAVLRHPLATYLGWPPHYISALAISLSAVVASAFYEEAAISTGRIWNGAIFNSVVESVRTGTMLVVALVTRDLGYILWTHAGLQIFRVILGYAAGYRLDLFRFSWNPSACRRVWRYAFPVSLSFVLAVGINYSDQILLSHFITPVEFAIYSIGCLTVAPLHILQNSVIRVLIPQMSEAFERLDTARAAELHRKATAELAYYLIPAVTGMVIFASPIITLLFTSKYSMAAQFLRPFAFSYLLFIFLPDAVARAKGDARWILKFSIIFFSVTVALCLVLTLHFGAMGALSGLLISTGLNRIYGFRYIRKTTGLGISRFLPLRLIARLCSVSAALGSACALIQSRFPTDLRWFLECGSAFTILYFVFTWRWGVRENSRSSEPRVKKVLMLTQQLGIGGLERMVLNLSMILNTDGEWRPEILVFDHLGETPDGNELVSVFRKKGIPVTAWDKSPGFSPKTVFGIARLALKGQFDVIHSHDLGALIYAVLAKGLGLLFFRRLWLVHTQHSFIHLDRKARYRAYERFFTRFVNRLTVVSEGTRQQYRQIGVQSERIHVIPNGIAFSADPPGDRADRLEKRLGMIENGDIDRRWPGLSRFRNEYWILYLARIHGRKGQDHAIEVWRKLDPNIRERLTLLFVGPETDEQHAGRLRTMIESSPDRERIFHIGPSKEPEIWLDMADIYLSCSEFEGMPLGPIEAAGSGLPMLLSKIPAHEGLNLPFRNFPLDDPSIGAKELALLYHELTLCEPGFRGRLLQASVVTRASFSLEAMAGRYKELYT